MVIYTIVYWLFGPPEFVVLGCISGQPLLGLGGDPVLTETSSKLTSSAQLNNRTTKTPNSSSSSSLTSSSSAVKGNGKEDVGAEENKEDEGTSLLINSNSCSRVLSKPNLSSPLLDPPISRVSASPLAQSTLDILPLQPQFLLLQTLCIQSSTRPSI